MKGMPGAEIPIAVVIARGDGAHSADSVPPETSSDYSDGAGGSRPGFLLRTSPMVLSWRRTWRGFSRGRRPEFHGSD